MVYFVEGEGDTAGVVVRSAAVVNVADPFPAGRVEDDFHPVRSEALQPVRFGMVEIPVPGEAGVLFDTGEHFRGCPAGPRLVQNLKAGW